MQRLDAPREDDVPAAAGRIPVVARPFVYVAAAGWLTLRAAGRLISRLFAGYLRITDLAGAAAGRSLRAVARVVVQAVGPLSGVGAAILRGWAWLVSRVLQPASQWVRRLIERVVNHCAPAASAAHRGVQLIERRTRRLRRGVRTAVTAAASQLRRVAGPPARAVVAGARRLRSAVRELISAGRQRRP